MFLLMSPHYQIGSGKTYKDSKILMNLHEYAVGFQNERIKNYHNEILSCQSSQFTK